MAARACALTDLTNVRRKRIVTSITLMDGERGMHAVFHMLGHMTMIQPDPGIVGNHVHGHHAGWQEFHNIGVPTVQLDALSMPMCRVDVSLIAHS